MEKYPDWLKNIIIAGVFVLLGLLVYSTSFQGVFLLDDYTNIVEYQRIKSLAWPWTFLQDVRRPLLYLSLAICYSVHQLDPKGYHFFNLLVHIITGFSLFKFLDIALKKAFQDRERFWLALCIAVIWFVHPLQTQSVTYIIQRAESLMAMFFVLSLYAAAKYFNKPAWPWVMACGICSLLSGLTKEVAVVLPVIILLYDRSFISASFKESISKHRWLYLLLSLTWVVMFTLLAVARPEAKPSAGFGYKGMSIGQYALTQPEIIFYYVRLVFWPRNLVFDYAWPPVNSWQEYLLPLVVIMAFLGACAARYQKFPKTAFLIFSFFLILAPSSSIIPLRDLAFEQRMYLPSAIVIAGVVLLLYELCGRESGMTRTRLKVLISLSLMASLVLGYLTFERNKVYHSELTMWKDVLTKRPMNARAHNNYGKYLRDDGRLKEARQYFEKAIALDADYADAYINLGSLSIDWGQEEQAIAYTTKAIELNPLDGAAYNNLGSIYANREEYDQAIPFFKQALEKGFTMPGVFHNLGVAYAKIGKPYEAIANIQDCLIRDPQYPEAAANLKEILARLRVEKVAEAMANGISRQEALRRFQEAVKSLDLEKYE